MGPLGKATINSGWVFASSSLLYAAHFRVCIAHRVEWASPHLQVDDVSLTFAKSSCDDWKLASNNVVFQNFSLYWTN